jgi:hypothetical protein
MVSPSAQIDRDPANKETDKAALRAIAQAAVDVELFTIPLYMTSLYSIKGTHQINDKGSTLYQGWTWPGAAPTALPADPNKPNEEAFNLLFSIFIEEMLHLQMAANMATAVGISPSFTSTSLQTPNHGWKCYGDHLTIIPNIIDLMDTFLEDPDPRKPLNVPVNIGPLDETRVALFLAIEQPDEQARAAIRPGAESKYFPKAPFEHWAPPQPLPMFGTIGHMYQCYYDYLHISYTDGTTLWASVLDANAVQQDHFNADKKLPQYSFSLAIDVTDAKGAFGQMCAMMDAITDQGEGSILVHQPDPILERVLEGYRAIRPNLDQLYPSYDNQGVQQAQSDDASARCDSDTYDHYERFERILELLPDIVTWATAKKAGNWTAADFQVPPGPGTNPHRLPTPEELAGAWNAIAHEGCFDESYGLLSKAVVGSIAGTTTVLESYWKDKKVGFPGPAMGGTGNRMATIWAALGRTPNLSLGLDPLSPGTLGHSCQAVDYGWKQGEPLNDCAQVQLFHSCIGSNGCHAEGGCGFVNKVTGGGSCSHPSSSSSSDVQGTCGGPVIYSAPGDNKCSTLGGCAVPISASQLYPPPPSGQPEGMMAVFDFQPDTGGTGGWKSVQVGEIIYKEGDKVADVAYAAFAKVMTHRGMPVPDEPPPPSVIRLVFPPST